MQHRDKGMKKQRSNSDIISDFIKKKGMKRFYLSVLLGVTVKTVYNMIKNPGPEGLKKSRLKSLNEIFKKYDYAGRVK